MTIRIYRHAMMNLVIVFLLLMIGYAIAIPVEELPDIPVRPYILSENDSSSEAYPLYIYDENGVMTTEEKLKFSKLSDSLYKHTKVSLAIAIVNNIGDYDVREYAIAIARKWGVGGTSDEGIIILLAMKQRKLSTEIGKGAEGYLPSLRVNRLQQNDMITAIKMEKYGEGILTFAYDIAEIIVKEKGTTLGVRVVDYKKNSEGGSGIYSLVLLGLFILFLAIVIRSRGSRGNGCLGAAITGGTSTDSTATYGSIMGRGGSFGGGFGSTRSSSSDEGASKHTGRGFGGGFGGNRFGGGGSNGW